MHDSVIRGRDLEKKCQLRDVIWLRGDTSALSALILVVIGIKLAHVDTALKGKKTTSHLLFNLFSSQPFFRPEAQHVFTAVYGMVWPGGLTCVAARGAKICDRVQGETPTGKSSGSRSVQQEEEAFLHFAQ